MLTFNPADRISAKDALNDIWIQNNSIQNPIDPKALNNLASFRVYNVNLLNNLSLKVSSKKRLWL